MSRPWTTKEIAALKRLETDPFLQCEDVAAELQRSKRACWQQFYRMRKAGLVKCSARTRELTDKQREIRDLCRAKELPARVMWEIVERLAVSDYCKRGHPMSGDNLPDGRRRCLACKRIHDAKHRAVRRGFPAATLAEMVA